MRSKLYSYIVNLMGRNNSRQDIWAKIKKHDSLKFSSNDAIRGTFQRIEEDRQRAIDFNKASAKQKFGALEMGCGKRSGSQIQINFHFNYTFPGEGVRSKTGRNAVHLTETVPLGSSKSEILKILNKAAQDWIDKHYQGRNIDTGRPRPTVDFLIAC